MLKMIYLWSQEANDLLVDMPSGVLNLAKYMVLKYLKSDIQWNLDIRSPQ